MDSLHGCIPVLFTRVPVPGLVKTRLSTRLGDEGCAVLQEALVLDLAMRISQASDQLVLCCSDEWAYVKDGNALRDAFITRVVGVCDRACRVQVLDQRGKDLGERVATAMAEVFAAGADSCMLLGSDLPDVGALDVIRTKEALVSSDVVFGPSVDGGYWLVALNEPFSELFENRRFSTDSVLSEALETCSEHDKKACILRTAMDVDEPGDIDDLLRGGVEVGSHVARVLRHLADSAAR